MGLLSRSSLLALLGLCALFLGLAEAGRRRQYGAAYNSGGGSGGYSSGGYSSGYAAGSTYAQQSSYSQQSSRDFGQLAQSNGQLQAESEEDVQQDLLLEDYNDSEGLKFGENLSAEESRTRGRANKWRTVTGSGSDSDSGGGQAGGSGLSKQDGWSSSSSWSSQSQHAAAAGDSEIDSLLQSLQGTGTNHSKVTSGSGSLGPGHTYYYQRRVYNWTSGSKIPGYSCGGCNSTYTIRRTQNRTRQGAGVGQSGHQQQVTQSQGGGSTYGGGAHHQGSSSVLQEQEQAATLSHSTSQNVIVESGGNNNEQVQQQTHEYRQPRGTRQPPLYYQQNHLQHGQSRQSVHEEQYQPTSRTVTTTTPRTTRQETYRTDVTCSNGVIRGQLITTSLGREVYAFLGIPFAKPPVGNLRFSRPQPVDNWNEPLIARTLPPACLQVNASSFPGNSGEAVWNPSAVSEDCLYLNIWVPASILRSKDVQLSSVLFWIYGGGFFSGSASLDIYNGAVLASENDLIVVSSQYRVGPLGFLYLNTPDAPGNAGFLDQVEALRWVNKNIRYFGGDRESVTLMGESCGASSVSMHLISPLSRGLFLRGIMMSGLVTAPYSAKSPAECERVSLELAKAVGCDTTEDASVITQCLRNADGMDLTVEQFKLFGFLDFPFVPVTDGVTIPSCPASALEKLSAKRADILTGTVKDEGTYFMIYEFQRYLANRANPQVTYQQFLEMMTKAFELVHTETETEAITNYYTNWKNPDEGRVNLQRVADAVSDGYFVCPNREFTDLWSRRGLNVWQYRFTQRTSTNPWPEWMGVMHGDEIEYFFGVPLRNPERFTAEERQLSVHIMNLVANFVKTGVPSNNWQRYTEQRPVYVELNANRITDEVTSNNLGPRGNECAFWSKILPRVAGKSSSVEQEDVASLLERLTNVCSVAEVSAQARTRTTTSASRREQISVSKCSSSRRLSSLHSQCQC